MNKFYSIPFKTFAVLLSFLFIVITILSALGVWVMYEMGVYTQSAAEVYSNMGSYIISTDASRIFIDLKYGYEHPSYYRYGVRYTVTDASGNVVYSDLNTHDYDIVYMADYAAYHWGSFDHYWESDVNDDPALKALVDESENVQYNPAEYYDDGSSTEGYYVVQNGYPTQDYTVTAYLLTGEYWGEYNLLCRGIPLAYALRFWIFPIGALSFLCFLLFAVFLMCAAGRRKNSSEVIKGPLDKIPFDIHTALMVCIILLFGWMIVEASYDHVFAVLVIAIAGSVGYFLVLSYFMSFAVRLKCGDVIRKSVIFIVLSFIFRQIGKLFKKAGYIVKRIPIIWRAVIIIIAVAFYNLAIALTYDTGGAFVLWVIETVILVPAAALTAISLKKIQKGGREISRGNLSYQIDMKYMTGSLKDFSEDLNSIGEGLSKAVDERMKSERFKTELITNVSHDIKTPLTSIINYVDLIKKEQPESETMRNYVDVLDRQSSRLKKLIEDLVEASKASTGNVNVTLEKCNVGVILAQAAGEYDEKLKQNELELIMSIPDEPCAVMVDGRHLWRVMDNLMNNICKYAQSGTRVYINLERSNGKVAVIFKNISKYPLNISSDELLERFTRGDSSRSTEGSGLGLSIANSLTELQGGTMSLTVDGDLFKVSLTFDAV